MVRHGPPYVMYEDAQFAPYKLKQRGAGNFDCLSEDLIGVVLSFLGVRCLDNACHVCKAVSQVARPLMPLWIGVAASAGEDSAAWGHCGKPLAGARQADPAGGAGSVPALSHGRHGRARPGDSAGGQCSVRNRVFVNSVGARAT